jgi:hypothetical protein
VQVVAKPWRDLLALQLCRTIEDQLVEDRWAGWQKP